MVTLQYSHVVCQCAMLNHVVADVAHFNKSYFKQGARRCRQTCSQSASPRSREEEWEVYILLGFPWKTNGEIPEAKPASSRCSSLHSFILRFSLDWRRTPTQASFFATDLQHWTPAPDNDLLDSKREVCTGVATCASWKYGQLYIESIVSKDQGIGQDPFGLR